MKVNARITLVTTFSLAAALALTGTASLLAPRAASATAQFATETGKSCGTCHTNPAGGGALTPFGEAFKANGNKLPK
jgi:mono/diheme cytochrome c family protein